ncbi:MAG: hypothetical protein N4A76_15255 [Firmicutes bacterium]|jgi:hypothetical protein|nr:hypothetical protein [Bacillota bacterium]
MSTFNKEEVTSKVKSMLSNFRIVGVGSRERFADDEKVEGLIDRGPEKYVPNYQSVIAFGDGNHKKDKDSNETFGWDYFFSELISPLEVVEYLDFLGYKSHIVHKNDIEVSLVNIGVKAGIGELTPVNSLVVRGYGLSPVLQAIITEAPLLADELPKAKAHCIQCNLCLKACPIRDEAYAPGDMSICACNKCAEACPV